MEDSLEFFDFCFCDDVDLWILSSSKVFTSLGIDLVTVELEPWDREITTSLDIAAFTDHPSCLIARSSWDRSYQA